MFTYDNIIVLLNKVHMLRALCHTIDKLTTMLTSQ